MAVSADQAAHNHPYWLEVHEVTPVSASILWTLRPPPISAIPLKLLRQRQSNQHNQSVASGSGSPASLSKTPTKRLTSEVGVVATRSLNRRVTKVTLRNISPNKQSRLAKQQSNQHLWAQRASFHHNAADNDDWPSDDGATAVDEDEARDEDDVEHERGPDDYAGNAEDIDEGDSSAKIFDSNISVCVNGIPWSQVMIGDRSASEAFIVVYGLSPSRDYELVLSVEGKHNSKAHISTSKAEPEIDDKALASNMTTTSAGTNMNEKDKQIISPSVSPARARAHTPPMQDTDANTTELPFDQVNIVNAANSAAVSSVLTGVMNASTLQASIRKARKEASRAESALKNEIDAIKRGLERMSDVDHRSKQKVLALQESIRQANLHAKEIDEEAIEVEAEREAWELKEKEKDQELLQVRDTVEQSVKEDDLSIKQDDDDIEIVAKELQKVTKTLEEQNAIKERLEKDKFAEMEQELARVQQEIENLLQPQQHTQAYNYQQYGQYPMPTHQYQGQGPSYASFSPQSMSNSRQKIAQRGGYRNVTSPASSSSMYTRRGQVNRNRPSGYPRSQEDTLYDFQSASSSSIHGSSLNPHNPEFIPASASSPNGPAKSALTFQTEYSPSVLSRPSFGSTSLYNMNQEIDRNSSISSMGLSPRGNTIGTNSLNLPWSVNPSNNHTTSGTSMWSNSSMVPSPTLSHDIWGAPSANVSNMTTASTTSPLSLRQKTSLPFDLNTTLLRGNQMGSAGIARDQEETAPISHFQHIINEGNSERRRDSAPVSPNIPSNGHPMPQ